MEMPMENNHVSIKQGISYCVEINVVGRNIELRYLSEPS